MTSSGEASAAATAGLDRAGPRNGARAGKGGNLGKYLGGTLVARFLREPLVQFMLIGASIFAAHAVVTPSVSADRLIVFSPEVRQSIIDTFKREHEGTEPSPDELARLIDVWTLNEITYREALAQGLDKGDEMIRDRIVHKMRLLIFGGIEVNEPTRQELEAWYARRHVDYDIPDLVSFIEVPFTGPDAETESRTVLQQILSESEPEDVQTRALIFADRPRHTLEPSFGTAFVDALVALPKGEWRVLQSSDGWHVVRLDNFVEGRKVELKEVDAQATQTWKDERRRILGIAATRDLGKNYVIRRDQP